MPLQLEHTWSIKEVNNGNKARSSTSEITHGIRNNPGKMGFKHKNITHVMMTCTATANQTSEREG